MPTDVTARSFPLNECIKARAMAKRYDPTDKHGVLISPRENARVVLLDANVGGGRRGHTECRVWGLLSATGRDLGQRPIGARVPVPWPLPFRLQAMLTAPPVPCCILLQIQNGGLPPTNAAEGNRSAALY